MQYIEMPKCGSISITGLFSCSLTASHTGERSVTYACSMVSHRHQVFLTCYFQYFQSQHIYLPCLDDSMDSLSAFPGSVGQQRSPPDQDMTDLYEQIPSEYLGQQNPTCGK